MHYVLQVSATITPREGVVSLERRQRESCTVSPRPQNFRSRDRQIDASASSVFGLIDFMADTVAARKNSPAIIKFMTELEAALHLSLPPVSPGKRLWLCSELRQIGGLVSNKYLDENWVDGMTLLRRLLVVLCCCGILTDGVSLTTALFDDLCSP